MLDQTPEEFKTEEFDVSEAVSFLVDLGIISDYADDYGEPGYSLDNPDGFFATGDWWCRDKDCDYPDRYPEDAKYDAGKPKVHGVSHHYKRLFERLEEAGMETAFYDKWTVANDIQVGEYPNIEMKSLAYRTRSDSYHWQPSILWDEEEGEYLTPHDGIERWIEVCLRQGKGITGPWTEADLEDQGFEEFNCNYESGWFDGQDDDPDKIMKELKERMGETHDILPWLKENSQFYMKFCVFVREKPKCQECDKIIDHGQGFCGACEVNPIECED
jgi:hypothetical protein